ncbi:SAM-dependent methyltransferase [Nocardia sp. NPDC020380]|uniref:SAM-dependent methyltransferase n=1 Tax=Nocardia sp. NPDC020380 TaxID=3364309 RepID=UPI003792D597
MTKRNRAPIGVDPTKPNAARVYNYMLDGQDNYEADRIVAERMLQVAPDTKATAWFSRRFLLKAVELAAEAGITQFLDIGAGIPISPNVHEVAQDIRPESRVVYIDFDPVVIAHANALLTSAPGVSSMLADIRNPDEIIERARKEHDIDFDRPVAIVIVGVLHFVMDDEQPAEILARFRDELAPGSLVAFTHASDHTNQMFMTQSSNDLINSPAQVQFRSPEQVKPLLDGFDIVEPGVSIVQNWLVNNELPETRFTGGGPLPETRLVVLGAVGRKP